MNTTRLHKKIPLKWWIGLTTAVLLAILAIGLKPRGISPPNHARWLTDRTGIEFKKIGIAYTDSISDLVQSHVSPEQTFSIELAYKARNYQEGGFHFILLLHDGEDAAQLLIGQWRASLIVMNGDDYEYRKKTDRITVTPPDESPDTQFITVTSGDGGTCVYLNGQLAAAKKGMRLKIPEATPTRLLIGNSVYGNHPWEGEIYGIGIFGRALSEEEVENHYRGWSKHLDFSFLKYLDPILLYTLNNSGANQVVTEAHPLQIPPRFKTLSPRFFYQKLNVQRIQHLLGDKDAVLNFFGFLPLGLLMGITLMKLGGKFRAHCVSLSMAAGFSVSLWIETVQAWMPARSSDLQDLILNTAGTLAGALLCRYFLFSKGRGTESAKTES